MAQGKMKREWGTVKKDKCSMGKTGIKMVKNSNIDNLIPPRLFRVVVLPPRQARRNNEPRLSSGAVRRHVTTDGTFPGVSYHGGSPGREQRSNFDRVLRTEAGWKIHFPFFLARDI